MDASAGTTLTLTNLDKVLFPAEATRSRPLTKRDLIRYYADDRAGDAAVPRRPAGQPAPLSRTASPSKGFWHKAVPDHAPDWIAALAQRRGRSRARPRCTSCSTARRAGVGGQLRRGRAARLDVDASEHPHHPTWALIDIDPGTDATLDDVLVLARLHRTALDHLGVAAGPR